MKKRQRIPVPVFKAAGQRLDLGCGNSKLPGAFGVDYLKTPCTSLEWNLEKTLPKRFWNRYGLVFSECVIDHLGNPLRFLQNCRLYAKQNGFVQAIADNADYWRYHKRGRPFGNYHASLWFKSTSDLMLQHKMMFQPGHLETMFKIAGLEVVETRYFWRQSLDWLFPKHLGSAYISIVGRKRQPGVVK